jgi:hypothetical protein
MKKQLAIILVILVVIMGIASFLILNNKNSNPSVGTIDPNKNTLELYEEISLNEVEKIMITTVNVNVKIIQSDNNNIRIIYKPYANEKTFKYELVDKILTLSVDEVQSDGFLIPADSELIYVYIPKNNNIELSFETGSGFIDVDEVNLKDIEVKSTSGIVIVSGSNIAEDLVVNADYGKISLRNISFKQLTVNTVSALVACSLADSLDKYYIDLASNIGAITINGEEVSNPYDVTGDNEDTEIPTITIHSKTGNISMHFIVEQEQ